MKRLAPIVCTLLFILAPNFAAADTLLATFFQTKSKEKSQLFLVKDRRGDIERFYFKNIKADGKTDRVIRVSLKDLLNGKVVLKLKGTDVITLKSDNLARHNGGHISIKYLKEWNAFRTNSFRSFEVELDRISDDWTLKYRGKRFKNMLAHVYKWGIHYFTVINSIDK